MSRQLHPLPAAELCVGLLHELGVFLFQMPYFAVEIGLALRVDLFQILDLILKLNDRFFEIEDKVSHGLLRGQKGS